MGFEATLDRITTDTEATLVQLHEDGEPLVGADPPSDPVFVLSDHNDFTADESESLAAAAERQVRVGPELLHADHAITVVHNWLDTDGYTSY